MSKKKEEKIVRMPENKLVNIIEKIVNEAVIKEKKEWIAEQKKSKASILETRIAKLESLLSKATITKKSK